MQWLVLEILLLPDFQIGGWPFVVPICKSFNTIGLIEILTRFFEIESFPEIVGSVNSFFIFNKKKNVSGIG